MSRKEIEEALASYNYLGQLEEGEEDGYRHWQLIIDGGQSPIRFSTLKRRLPTAHLEPRSGPIQQAINYVTKKETRIIDEPRLEHGIIRHSDEKGRRKDVEVVREAILEKGLSADEVFLQVPESNRMTAMVEKLVAARDRSRHTKPRQMEVIWLYGPPGTGKTSLAVEMGGTSYYRVTDYQHPFDSYSGEGVLILDEFDGEMRLSTLLNVLDIWPTMLPARYADRVAAYSQVVLVSNEEPWSFYSWASVSRRQALARRINTIMYVDASGAHDDTDHLSRFNESTVTV